MKKYLQKKLNNEKGMTLIELLAVIVIIAIIAAIAIPAIGNIIENSRHNAVKADFQNVLASAELYFTENGSAIDATFTETNTAKGNFIQDDGSIQTFIVTRKTGGNTISGTAKVGDTTIYTIATPGKTNAELSALEAADMKLLITTP